MRCVVPQQLMYGDIKSGFSIGEIAVSQGTGRTHQHRISKPSLVALLGVRKQVCQATSSFRMQDPRVPELISRCLHSIPYDVPYDYGVASGKIVF